MAVRGSSMHNTCANQEIPSLFAVFVSPTLAFGTPKARGMGERVWSEEISQMLVCMNSFPFTAFLLNLASFASVFFPPFTFPPQKTNDFF